MSNNGRTVLGLGALLGLGATAWWLSSRGKTLAQQASDLVGEATGVVQQAWSVASQAIIVPEALQVAVARLVAAVPDIPIVITSGLRTAAQQASAMATKIQRGENLYALYTQDDLLSEVLAVSGSTADPDVGAMTAVLEEQIARGRFISRHMRGDAVDIRTRNLSADQLAELVAAVQAQGGQTVIESDHLHVEELPA